jgi:hypothetical protein
MLRFMILLFMAYGVVLYIAEGCILVKRAEGTYEKYLMQKANVSGGRGFRLYDDMQKPQIQTLRTTFHGKADLAT